MNTDIMFPLQLVYSANSPGKKVAPRPRPRANDVCPRGLANQCRKLTDDDPEAARLLETVIHEAVALCDEEGPIVTMAPAVDAKLEELKRKLHTIAAAQPRELLYIETSLNMLMAAHGLTLPAKPRTRD